ncbi:hypothetical protein BC937DRAFT_93052 [Endogone sp. FLAS-F59071]|nr:hypothetical protein BC937DRAFT_93052 [Endogone sp. FLAS-F59071]|eukprot:RUS14994.1 hypothetical protein BC937DRAFT_93052 [Endogone sp. FLAS-F59071]
MEWMDDSKFFSQWLRTPHPRQLGSPDYHTVPPRDDRELGHGQHELRASLSVHIQTPKVLRSSKPSKSGCLYCETVARCFFLDRLTTSNKKQPGRARE